ncbi:MAG: trimeric intracellular cation channel family protein [Firmicutes bacterium]|nr:trimeric intracellular cation channel family protein [Bacillota bacterium]MBQ6841681.1 trimeric intracellular cation channel family protein [Bacillota bacterium]
MQLFILLLEIIGTVSFAVSGAMTALKKNMDLLGTCILGLTTAVGGGMIRDILLGIAPPNALQQPRYMLIAIASSLLVFMPVVQYKLAEKPRLFDRLMLVSDALGLGIFTVIGMKVAMEAGFGSNGFLVVFVGVMTGVGGGVLRDLFAGNPPYIFVKHIYASAAIVGAIICLFAWPMLGDNAAMMLGTLLIVGIRLLAAKYRWSLPKGKHLYSYNKHE